MYDRAPTYPGRVELTDVETGVKKKYDMVMADEPLQEGTPPTKANLLTDETAALFGLGADATPDEVFKAITKFSNVQIVDYTGTGKYGKSGKNSVVFQGRPKIILITPVHPNSGYTESGCIVIFGDFLKDFSNEESIDDFYAAGRYILFLSDYVTGFNVNVNDIYNTQNRACFAGDSLYWWYTGGGQEPSKPFYQLNKNGYKYRAYGIFFGE